MLPRKAPSALKTFHELAVGVKDAYEAVGATPTKPEEDSEEFLNLDPQEREGRKVLWEFNGNLNFVSVVEWSCGVKEDLGHVGSTHTISCRTCIPPLLQYFFSS